jgi:hypothetical protein
MWSVNDIIMRYDNAKTTRSWFEPVWDEIFSAYLPRRMGVYETALNQGRDRSIKIYDGTPGGSLLRLAAVLNSTLTNQATNWFELETDDEELNEIGEVKEWLESDRRQYKKSIENSNFYAQINEFYTDICGPATACLYAEESREPGQDLFFSTIHIKGVYLLHDDQGNLTCIFVCREMTAWQIQERWGSKKKTGNIPDRVRGAMDSNRPNEPFEVLHVVYKNDDYVERNLLDPMKFKWASAWIMVQDKAEIDRGGYKEMPYVVEFWSKASAEVYGRGPAWDALSDTKGLYKMKKSLLYAGEMATRPPILLPDSTTTYPINWKPGGLGYFNPNSKHPPYVPNIGQGFPVGKDLLESERNQIRDWFYSTQLQLIDAKKMTAEEVRARMAENARILGPTFGRLIGFFDRLFGRMRGLLADKGKLRQAPGIVKRMAIEKGVNINVRFVSPIVKAASLAEVQGITHTAGTAIAWASDGNRPDILDNFDFDYGIRRIADLDGAPPEFLLDRKKVKAIRERRQKRAEMEDRIEALERGAGISKQAAEAQDKFISSKVRSMSGGLSK